MDRAGGYEGGGGADERSPPVEHDAAIEAPPNIGGDERRMHVRAYNFWVSLLHGRQFPAVADLQPERLGDFGPHSVLLDFGADPDDPHIPWLGTALREEGDLPAEVRTIADVPGRSLLSRLTEHCQQIMQNRAPIGFEAEFVNVRRNCALYRGILLPFSSDGRTIDVIYGVINWKELADPATTAEIVAAARAALARTPPPPSGPALPVWADGPSSGMIAPDGAEPPLGTPAAAASPAASPPASPGALADRLATAREAGSAVHAAEMRGRAALYRALGVAYDLALAADADPVGYAALLARTGLSRRLRSPWMPIVRLVFGRDYHARRLREYAAVLAHAWRHDVAAGGMRGFLENGADGLRGIVAAERACRRAERTA